ncbi:MAG: response regulator [Atribacterota bacterium]
MGKTISILVADDEELVRRGIRYLLADSRDYKVIGEAENGHDLIDKIIALRPQAIILDVRMPIMDGLTALEKIKVSFPEVKVVILSGYNDFQLLKKAIQLGVTDYLLKPCNPEELHRVLEKVRSSLLREEQARLERKKLEIRVKNCSSAFLEKTFHQLIKNELSPLDFKRRIKLLNIKTEEAIVLVATIYDSYQVLSMDTRRYRSFCSKVENNIRSILEQMGGKTMSIFQEDNGTFVTILSPPFPSSMPLFTHILCDELQKRVSQVFLVAYSDRVTLFNLDKAYQQAMNSLRPKIFLVSMETQESPLPIITFFPEEMWRNLLHYVRLGNKSMVMQKLTEVFDCLDRNRGDPPQYAQLTFYVAAMAFRFALEEKVPIPNALNPFIRSREIEKLHTRDDLFIWLQKYLEAILEVFQKNNIGSSVVVRRCLQFLDQHCCENMSLTKLAHVVDLSPAYLSFLIKQETGKTFSQHLAERRMAIARKLLCQGNFSVSEVANRVGYENVRYFSEVFRKFEGMTPQQFRKGKNCFSKNQKISDKIKR